MPRFTVESVRQGTSVRSGKEFTGTSVRVDTRLLDNGSFVANFSDIVIADRIAELLNIYGVR